MSVEMGERMIEEKGERGAPLASKVKYSSFEQMRDAKVLNLSRSQITTLPKSLSELKRLRALILYDCARLKKLPCLSSFKELQLLDLSRTSIEELPQGMEDLVNLRHLRLSYTRRLKTFRAGVLPRLSSLEELSMHESRWVWGAQGGGASVDEIAALGKLSDLVIQLGDWPDLVACMSPEQRKNLRRFYLSVGFWGAGKPGGENTVAVSGCDLARGGRVFPENTLRLVIENCQLSELVSVSSLGLLKDCCIKRCRRIEYLTAAENGAGAVLPSLERLEVSWVPSMRTLHKGVAANGSSFASLKILTLTHCHGLMSLFSGHLLKRLRNLEKISVSDCYVMEEMVGGEGEERVLLPRLKTLVLRYLSKLKRVCVGKWMCESLESVEVDHCPLLKQLPMAEDELPQGLRVIYGSRKWWGTLEWERPDTSSLLLPLLHPLPQEEFEDEEDEGSCIEEA